MLAWIVLPLTLFPGTKPPECQLEVVRPVVLEERALESFDARVAQYIRLHRRLERELPPEQLFQDSEDMSVAIDALHAAIVDARPNAQIGNMFTPLVAYVLTHRLQRAVTANGYTAAEVLAAINAGYRPGMAGPEVNGRLPRIRNIEVWPALHAVLPSLPNELVFRFVGRDLVLWDFHADLIVDILEDALPPAK